MYLYLFAGDIVVVVVYLYLFDGDVTVVVDLAIVISQRLHTAIRKLLILVYLTIHLIIPCRIIKYTRFLQNGRNIVKVA